MTISAVRTINRGSSLSGCARGLTLIETVLALVIILIVIGIGLAYQFDARDKDLLQKAAVKLEAMSSRGHAMSVLNQKPFWLRIEHDKVVLAGADIRSPVPEEFTESSGLTADRDYGESHEEIYDTLAAGEAVIAIRRWGAKEDAWIRPEPGESVIWHFQSTGLCEPISIRVAKDESYVIMQMNPLTARVDDREAVFVQ